MNVSQKLLQHFQKKKSDSQHNNTKNRSQYTFFLNYSTPLMDARWPDLACSVILTTSRDMKKLYAPLGQLGPFSRIDLVWPLKLLHCQSQNITRELCTSKYLYASSCIDQVMKKNTTSSFSFSSRFLAIESAIQRCL